jgi:hypothetical protein
MIETKLIMVNLIRLLKALCVCVCARAHTRTSTLNQNNAVDFKALKEPEKIQIT